MKLLCRERHPSGIQVAATLVRHQPCPGIQTILTVYIENKKESGKKKVRAIDDFLEELKRKQDEKERLKAAGGNPDVFDSAPAEVGYAGFIDDHKTTNIHVGDLDFSVSFATTYQLLLYWSSSLGYC